MRFSMWMGVAVAATSILAACGGSSGEDTPDFEVTVKVDGVADSSNPLTDGESTTINVDSGATLVFDSEIETRWTPTATNSTYDVNTFSFNAKSLTVNSNGGGTLSIVFSDKEDAARNATLTVVVAAKQFARVPIVDGEIQEWTMTYVRRDDLKTIDHNRTRAVTNNDGSYGLQFAFLNFSDSYTSRTDYDAQDRTLGTRGLVGIHTCSYSTPVAWYNYPMQVGATWSGEAERTCDGETLNKQAYVRTVEAFERVTVPAGTFDAVRVKSVVNFTVYTDPSIPGGQYTYTRTCWWAVDIGRHVKCIGEYDYPDGTPDYYTRSSTEILTSLGH